MQFVFIFIAQVYKNHVIIIDHRLFTVLYFIYDVSDQSGGAVATGYDVRGAVRC